MLKKILICIAFILSILLGASQVLAVNVGSGGFQVLGPWYRTAGALILPNVSGDSLGGPANPISNGYFTNLWASTTSFTTAGGNIDWGGFNISDVGTLTAAKLVATSTSATSTFSTGGIAVGTNQFVVQQNSGNVGVASTTPFSLLSVNPNGVSVPAFSVGSSTQTSFVVNANLNNNVGIGTSNPQSLLQVGGGANNNATIQLSDASANQQSKLQFLSSSSQKNFQLAFNTNVNGGYEITRSTAGGGSSFSTPDFVISSAGNVGISTTTPGTGSASDILDIIGGNVGLDTHYLFGQGKGYANGGGNANFATLQLYNNSTGQTIVNNQGFGISLQTAGTDKMTILNNGNVGIATTTPAFSFSVGSTTVTTSNTFAVDVAGNQYGGGGKPSTSCAGSCVLSTQSHDSSGTIFISGVQTVVTLTFYTAKPWAPNCTVSDSLTTGNYDASSTPTTLVMSTAASLGTGSITYNCQL